jgi:quercetin dioxygenase-like cupin family protein
MPYFNWNEIAFQKAREGTFYKTIAGKNMQMFYLKLEPGQITNHNHPQEQIGYILVGKVELTIGTETKICLAGEAYYIPSNLQHGFKVMGDERLEYIEIFSPPKDEHKKLN